MSEAEQGIGTGHSARSVSGRDWRWAEIDDALVRNVQKASGVNELTARLLVQRGVHPDEAKTFLSPTLRGTFPDPASFADMEIAAQKIVAAMEGDASVAVFADYDVDGATSAALLVRYFRHFGKSLVLYVPDRLREGYGPNAGAFDALKSEGVDLVITVDCGAAAVDALEHAVMIDLGVIVLDHHLMAGAMPPAVALVNPNRTDCESGAGASGSSRCRFRHAHGTECGDASTWAWTGRIA